MTVFAKKYHNICQEYHRISTKYHHTCTKYHFICPTYKSICPNYPYICPTNQCICQKYHIMCPKYHCIFPKHHHISREKKYLYFPNPKTSTKKSPNWSKIIRISQQISKMFVNVAHCCFQKFLKCGKLQSKMTFNRDQVYFFCLQNTLKLTKQFNNCQGIYEALRNHPSCVTGPKYFKMVKDGSEQSKRFELVQISLNNLNIVCNSPKQSSMGPYEPCIV